MKRRLANIVGIVAIGCFIGPLIMMLCFSIFSFYRYPQLFPTQFTLLYWKNLFTDNVFYSALLNSVIIGGVTGIINCIFAFMGSRALVMYEFPMNKYLRKFINLPLFIPHMCLFLGLHLVFMKLKLLNSYTGIILAHLTISLPYGIRILMGQMEGVSCNYEHVALSLGYSSRSYVFKVLIPMIAPGFALSFSMSFLLSFGEYFSTFLIGGGITTLSTMMYPLLQYGSKGDSSTIMIVFMTINIMIFTLSGNIAQKLTRKESYLYDA